MASLIMTKILVADLDAAHAFYTRVCGFVAVERIEDDSFAEIMLQPPGASTAAALVLITYRGEPVPPPGECVLVFETGDVGAFLAKAVEAGASIMQPPTDVPSLSLTYALARDPEGHVLEAISRR